MPEKPNVSPPTDADSPVEPWMEGRRCIRSTTEVAPLRSMSARWITTTGNAVSASTRRIAEPVISTRSSEVCCARVSCAANIAAVPHNAVIAARETTDLLNLCVSVLMSSPDFSCRDKGAKPLGLAPQ